MDAGTGDDQPSARVRLFPATHVLRHPRAATTVLPPLCCAPLTHHPRCAAHVHRMCVDRRWRRKRRVPAWSSRSTPATPLPCPPSPLTFSTPRSQAGDAFACANVAYTAVGELYKKARQTHWGYDLKGCKDCRSPCGRLTFVNEDLLRGLKHTPTSQLKRNFSDALGKGSCQVALLPPPPPPPSRSVAYAPNRQANSKAADGDATVDKLPPALPEDVVRALEKAESRPSQPLKKIELGKAHALIHGSCFDVIKLLPKHSVDLIIVDPPYDMNLGSWDRRWTPAEWQRLLSHVWRVLKPGGRFVVACVRDFEDEVNRHVRPDLGRTTFGRNPCNWYHGAKDNMRNRHFVPQDSENILVFYRKADYKALALDEALRDEQQTTFFFHPKEGLVRGTSRPDGSMKPIGLMRDLVRTFEMSGDGVVLDFCMKTGICGRGALLEGRRFIGVEADGANYARCLEVWQGFLQDHPTLSPSAVPVTASDEHAAGGASAATAGASSSSGNATGGSRRRTTTSIGTHAPRRGSAQPCAR